MAEVHDTAAIRRVVTVQVPIETAFRVFTEHFGAWWPLKRSPLDNERADEAMLEPRIGGAVSERWADGRVNSGEVTVWEPPGRVVFSWLLGGAAERATEIEVRFTPVGAATRVQLEHRGWEGLSRGDAARTGYAAGWEDALGRFADKAVERGWSRAC
jgi:uncharacterized protein YndB with AHSA1/START domain